MASIYDIKPAFQKCLRPLVNLLARCGVTANDVTWLAILLSAVGGWCVLQAVEEVLWLLWIPVILFVRMALNAIDGMLAREHNQQTRLGAILNEVGDIVSDAMLYLPLMYLLDGLHLAVVVFVLLGTLSEFCGVLSQALTGQRRYDGPMGKSDRAFVMGLYCIGHVFLPTLSRVAGPIFWVLNAMLVACCLNRLKFAVQENIHE